MDAFDSDKDVLEEMKAHYKRGGLGDMVVKKRLIGVLQEILDPIRVKRAELEKNPGEVIRILSDGSERAQVVAAETLREVRKAMRLNYF